MTYHLMNSAMMPSPGQYTMSQISAEKFFDYVKEAAQQRQLKSWIGYPQNAQIIEQNTGIKVAINKATTVINSGDVLLCMRLKYRTANKGSKVDINDFEYFKCNYR